jgi:hypothetical protein
MHPLLSNPRRLALYLLAWVPFGVFVHAILRGSSRSDGGMLAVFAGVLALFAAFIALSAYYSNRLAPLATSTTWRVVGVQAGAAGISTLLWIGMGSLAIRAIESVAQREVVTVDLPRALPLMAGIGLVGFLTSAIVHYLSSGFEERRAVERRALELQVTARDAELKMLRAQIDPHFLFNSLHSISALTMTDPPAARKMCVGLGDFLRATLQVGSRPFITLREELALVDRYLGIEQVRLGNRLQVSRSIADDVTSVLVPPLLLHPLVENAITHGIAHLLDGGRLSIVVKATSRTPPHLFLQIVNDADPDRPKRTGTGVGLQNVKRRLYTVYGDAASLTTSDHGESFQVELLVPIGRETGPADAVPTMEAPEVHA